MNRNIKHKRKKRNEALLPVILLSAALLLIVIFCVVLMGRGEEPGPGTVTTVDPATTVDPVTLPTTEEKETTGPTVPPVSQPIDTDPVTDPVTTEPPATDPVTTDPPPPPPPGVVQHVYAGSLPASEEVGESWFADALFLGDSRTVGLANFSGVTSTYYALTSLNISTAHTKAFLGENEDRTILQQVAKDKEDGKTYSKIYLWFGLNELGWSGTASFINLYTKLINELRTLLPDAQVYVVSVVPVSKKVSETSPYGVTNENCHKFNTAIAKMADDLDIYFVNAAADFADDTGALQSTIKNEAGEDKTLAVDGIHFGTLAVRKFFTYLRTHTVAVNA